MPYCPAIVGAHATRSASVIAALQRQRQQLQCPAGMGAAPRRLPACKRRRAGPRIGNTTRMSTYTASDGYYKYHTKQAERIGYKPVMRTTRSIIW